jgi:hypothetical protein
LANPDAYGFSLLQVSRQLRAETHTLPFSLNEIQGTIDDLHLFFSLNLMSHVQRDAIKILQVPVIWCKSKAAAARSRLARPPLVQFLRALRGLASLELVQMQYSFSHYDSIKRLRDEIDKERARVLHDGTRFKDDFKIEVLKYEKWRPYI